MSRLGRTVPGGELGADAAAGGTGSGGDPDCRVHHRVALPGIGAFQPLGRPAHGGAGDGRGPRAGVLRPSSPGLPRQDPPLRRPPLLPLTTTTTPLTVPTLPLHLVPEAGASRGLSVTCQGDTSVSEGSQIRKRHHPSESQDEEHGTNTQQSHHQVPSAVVAGSDRVEHMRATASSCRPPGRQPHDEKIQGDYGEIDDVEASNRWE